MTSLPKRLVWTMAVACGATVANLYFNQPLLVEIAGAFGRRQGAVGLVPTLTQVGYAAGMLFIVPLGDALERRRLVVALSVVAAGALLLCGLAPGYAFLCAASLLLGLTSSATQILVPFAATLAPPAERGRVVGTVMSGVLMGVLLSRTAAGLVGAHLGWRAIFFIGAGLMLLIALLLRAELPVQRGTETLPYAALLGSIGELARSESALRLHAFLGALGFASFSAFWATLALRLHDLPGHYGPEVAGLFGLVGVAGALSAPLAGRYADRRHPLEINAFALAVLFASFVVLGLSGASLVGLAAGVLLLDAGAQASHVSNQSRIFALRPAARSRVNTVYMVSYFIGGALGSLAGTRAYAGFGWMGVCAACGLFSGVAFVAAILGRRGLKAAATADGRA